MDSRKKGIKIIQCNIQSVSKHKEELQRTLMTGSYTAAFLSETWSKPENENSRMYNISGYNRVLNSRHDGYGGAAIYIHKDYGFQHISIPLTSDGTQSVAIYVPILKIVFAAVYFSPSIPLNDLQQDINLILTALAKFPKVIFGGDFNCHHTLWGNEKTTPKGATILQAINTSDLILLNDGSPTYKPQQLNKRATAIDLTLVSSSLVLDCSWTVKDESIGSHHLIIETEWTTQVPHREKFVYNKKQIQADINRIDTLTVGGINDLTREVGAIIKRNKLANKFQPKYWWSDDVEAAWRTKQQALSDFNRNSTPENLINLKRSTAIFLRLKKANIRENINRFAEEIDPQTSSAELWSKIRRLTGKKACTRNNVIVDDPVLATEFMDLHVGPTDIYPENVSSFSSTSNSDILDQNKWGNILNRKKSTAPGVDRITYDMLKSLSPQVTKLVLIELNNYWRQASLPEHLKEIRIIVVPKPGKDNSTPAGNRPISLVPTLTKTLNSAVLDELNQFIDNRQILPKLSFGFRKGQSTNTCITYVTNLIQANRRSGLTTAGIFLDLSNAFNAVRTDKLEQIMAELGVPQEYIRWITSFLRNRTVTMRSGTEEIKRIISNGLPQGDVLSPVLFNLYTAGLHDIADDDTVLVQYADDFFILVSGTSHDSVTLKAQAAIDRIVRKSAELNLEINPEKTKAIIFKATNVPLGVKVGGNPIETVLSYKYLGIYLDRTNSYGKHIRELRHKIQDRMNMLKVISKIKSGGHPETMRLLYKALIRSAIEYGCTAFGNASKTNIESLQTIINQCWRKTTGCSRTTPRNTLAALAAESPLDIRIEQVTCKEIARYFLHGSVVADQLRQLTGTEIREDMLTLVERTFLKHRSTFEAIIPTVKVLSPQSLDIQTVLLEAAPSKRNSDPRALKQAFLYLQNSRYKHRPNIYTDASKIGNTCGIGVYCPSTNRRISLRLNTETCIMTAELFAIAAALDHLEEEQIFRAVLFTDSLSSCQLIEGELEERNRNSMIQDIIAKASFLQVTIQWIPSHTAIKGNDIADELAKAGAQSDQILNNGIFIKDALSMFNQQRIDNTNKWYTSYAEEKGKHFFAIQPNYNESPWYKGKQLGNGEVRTLNRLMAGHSYANNWLAKMKLVHDPECDVCLTEDTADHVVLHCNKYVVTRSQYDFDGKFWTLIDLFKTNDLKIFRDVVHFLTKIKAKL